MPVLLGHFDDNVFLLLPSGEPRTLTFDALGEVNVTAEAFEKHVVSGRSYDDRL